MLNNVKITAIIFLLFSTAALVIAYILEYFFNMMPCKLCLYERVIFYVVTVLSSLCLIKNCKILVYMMLCSYLIGIIISFYHMGLEFGWFPDVLGCTHRISENITVEELKNNLLKVASCDRAHYVLGISLATWNLLYLLAVSIISLRFYFRKTGKLNY